MEVEASKNALWLLEKRKCPKNKKLPLWLTRDLFIAMEVPHWLLLKSSILNFMSHMSIYLKPHFFFFFFFFF